ncbi:MAG: MerR family transcriptional regulator [Bryobacteraceae bacterium]|nr:MerR family transcriptional regulator [Bryobacteraceae bacterium]
MATAIASKPAGGGLISMKVMLQHTRVTRQAVHFYLRNGLLPRPVRTSRTYSLYSSECIELLNLIGECQTELRLSLREIADLFARHQYSVKAIRFEMGNHGGHTGSVAALSPRPSPAASSGSDHPYPASFVAELQKFGVLAPEASSVVDASEVARAAWKLAKLGVRPQELKSFRSRADHEAEADLNEMLRALGKSVHDYPSAAKLIRAFEEFQQATRRGSMQALFVRQTCRSAQIFIGPNQKHIFPSETFLAKSGLNQEIDRLHASLDRKPDDLAALVDLGRAYYLRSDWLNLYSVAQRIHELDPGNTRAVADMSRALVYLGRTDESIHLLEDNLRKGSDPLLKFRLGQVLVQRARRMGTLDMLEAITRKQELAREALRECRKPAIRRWILLDLALDSLSVADPLRFNPPSAEDLEALYREYMAIPDKGLGTLGRISLTMGRVLAAYALYMVYQRAGSLKADALRKKIIQMDPHAVLFARGPETGSKPRTK